MRAVFKFTLESNIERYKLCSILRHRFVVVPVWTAFRLQRLVPGAAAPPLCCDSRPVHRTAGWSQASVDRGAADVSSVGVGILVFTPVGRLSSNKPIVCHHGTAATDPLTFLQLASNSTGGSTRWTWDVNLRLQLRQLYGDRNRKVKFSWHPDTNSSVELRPHLVSSTPLCGTGLVLLQVAWLVLFD